MAECYIAPAGGFSKASIHTYEVYNSSTNYNITLDPKASYILHLLNYNYYASFQTGYELTGYIKNGVYTQLTNDSGAHTVTFNNTTGVLNISDANSHQMFITIFKVE